MQYPDISVRKCTLLEEIKRLEKIIANLIIQKDKIENEISLQRNAKNIISDEQNKLQSDINIAKNIIDSIEYYNKNLLSLKNSITQWEAHLNTINSDLEKKKQELIEYNNIDIIDKEKLNTDIKKQISAYTQELQNMKDKVNDKYKEYAEIERKQIQKREELQKYEEDLDKRHLKQNKRDKILQLKEKRLNLLHKKLTNG